jgi:2-polyprenyl-6-methoxyphenol hydroxylase-like FAD-dependent oxidoreductase
MKKRSIKKVAVIGSGIMGSGIACHFANIGVQVLLLDIVPRELTEAEKSKGLTLENKIVRNRIVNDSLKASLKSKPSPIYNQKFADRITTGNLDDETYNTVLHTDTHKVADLEQFRLYFVTLLIHHCDSKIMDIFEGTGQIQHLIVARNVLELSSKELK